MPTVLVAHPSADVYGADLQLLQSISALTGRGWRVVVALPGSGALVPQIEALGAEVLPVDFPVLQRASASAGGLARLAADGARVIPRLRRVIRDVGADVVYVNTVTLPWWLTAARAARTPSVCHVHEAEDQDSTAVRTALAAPLLQADRLIVISEAAMAAATSAVPALKSRARLIYNGVPGPQVAAQPAPLTTPTRLAVVSRLSPRKGVDVALDAVGELRMLGYDVELDIYGTAYTGYEWFEQQLVDRAAQPDLAGAVRLRGYVSPVWPALAEAHIVLMPSLREPFGNALVEAQLAQRPVVAAAAAGHLETVKDGETGLLVPPGDAAAMAEGVARLIKDPGLALRLGEQARAAAIARFSVKRYADDVVDLLTELLPPAK